MRRVFQYRTTIAAVFAGAWLLLSLAACSQDNRVENRGFATVLQNLLDHSVPEISVAVAADMAGDVRFVDARERAEYDVSHIDGAVWSGYDDFDISRLAEVPKDEVVIVYCSVGYRSEKVAEKLIDAGYEHVWNLYGGIFEWKNREEAVVDPAGRPTDKVHAFDRTWGRWLQQGEKVYNK